MSTPKSRRVFTDDEIERFKQLARQDTPRDRIAELMGKEPHQIVNLHATLKRNGSFRLPLPHALGRTTDAAPNPLEGREDEIRRLSAAGKGYREIAREMHISAYKMHVFMSEHGLLAEKQRRWLGEKRLARLQHSGTHCPPRPIRLAPVRLPDVDEADVRLGAMMRRELERGAA